MAVSDERRGRIITINQTVNGRRIVVQKRRPFAVSARVRWPNFLAACRRDLIKVSFAAKLYSICSSGSKPR